MHHGSHSTGKGLNDRNYSCILIGLKLLESQCRGNISKEGSPVYIVHTLCVHNFPIADSILPPEGWNLPLSSAWEGGVAHGNYTQFYLHKKNSPIC